MADLALCNNTYLFHWDMLQFEARSLQICFPNVVALIRKHFRMRMWGTVTMMQKLLLDKQCWLDHIMLNKFLSSLCPPILFACFV